MFCHTSRLETRLQTIYLNLWRTRVWRHRSKQWFLLRWVAPAACWLEEPSIDPIHLPPPSPVHRPVLRVSLRFDHLQAGVYNLAGRWCYRPPTRQLHLVLFRTGRQTLESKLYAESLKTRNRLFIYVAFRWSSVTNEGFILKIAKKPMIFRVSWCIVQVN